MKKCISWRWKKTLQLGGVFAWSALGTTAHAAVGAATPFTTLEAENGTCTGTAPTYFVVPATPPTLSSPALEASGRAFVPLTATGQSVSWSNPVANANGINVRFCIPDAPTGGGTQATLGVYVNGTRVASLQLNSAHAWLYETTLASNGQYDAPTGSATNPHLFWDEAHILLPSPVAAGGTIKLQRDSGDTAAYYDIDCVDVEAVPAPLSRPAGSLSITDSPYNADPLGNTDSGAAIQNCLNAAHTSGQIVWIPEGTFLSTTSLSATGVAIQGAGMWYAAIHRAAPSGLHTSLVLNGGSIQDVHIDTTWTTRANGDHGVSVNGSNWLVKDVWIEHTQAGVWASGTDGTVENCRVDTTYADGINLNNGNDLLGIDLTATNNFVRGTGDDGIAVYSNNANGTGTTMDTILVDHNTTVAPWWADGLRIAGGTHVTMTNNWTHDAFTTDGMVVGIYGSAGFPTIGAVIRGNLIERSGGVPYPYAVLFGDGGTGTNNSATFSENTINDSPFTAIDIEGNASITLGTGNVINNTGQGAIVLEANTTGSGTVQGNIAVNVADGQAAFTNKGTASYPLTGNNWQVTPPVADGTYATKARNSGLALDVTHGLTTPGSPVEQWTPSGAGNQQWELTSLGGNVYRIVGVSSTLALQVPGSSTANGTVLDIDDYADGLEGTNQMWTITPTDSGYYSVVNVNSGLAMEVYGGSGTAGAAVDQWTNNGATNKQWSFTP